MLAIAVALELLRPAIHPPSRVPARHIVRTTMPLRLAPEPISIVPPRPEVAPRPVALL